MFDHYGVGFSLLLRRRPLPSFAGDAAAVVVAVAVAGACGGCRGVVWWSVELLTPVLHGSYIPVALTPVPCHHGDLVTRG